MGYLPKSKYKISETGGGEYSLNGFNYKGPIILTSGGAYAGKNPKDLSRPLFNTGANIKNISRPGNNLWPYRGNKIYSTISKNNHSRRIDSPKPIVSTKNIPTEQDYQRGYYIRYFCQRSKVPQILHEIDKKIYKSLLGRKKEYDYVLFTPGFLKWGLEGNVVLANTTSLNKELRFFPFLDLLFPDLEEFRRYREATHQIAEPGMLVYKNQPTKEYVGLFHVHPDKGPMVGPVHVPEKHENLMFTDKYYNTFKPVETDPEGLKNGLSSGYKVPKNVKGQITRVVTPTTTSAPTPSTPPPSTPSYGGGSSGGGGGGY